MKRRILMVSAMILILGSQVQMYAQKKGGPDYKRPGMEMKRDCRPGGPMHEKAISKGDIVRLQDFYWKKFRVKLSKKEAEKILIVQMRDKGRHDFAHAAPPPIGKRPMRPQGPQRPPRR